MNDKQFKMKWIYYVLKGWGGQTCELNALEWERNCYVTFRVKVNLTRQVLVSKIIKQK